MKPFLLIIALSGVALLFSFGFQNTPSSDNEKCKEVLDSADVLVETGVFSVKGRALKTNKERNIMVSMWFLDISSTDITCLLESKDKLHQFYGYTLAGMLHYDSLKNNYSYLLKDTTTLQIRTDDGLIDSEVALGNMLKTLSGYK